MITGDNPLTAAHVARDVEIVDREVMILDLKEGTTTDELVWRNVDETKVIPVNPSEPFDKDVFDNYDICITGAALKQYESRPSWLHLVRHTWVYARVSPTQKEFILHTLKDLGFVTLMAGDGTNDVGALKAAHIGVALLDGTQDDLKKIAEHQKLERMKKVYEQQCKISARFNQPPPPPPPALKEAYPELARTQEIVSAEHKQAKKRNPMEKVGNTKLHLVVNSCGLNSLTWLQSLRRCPSWMMIKKFHRSNLGMRLVLHHSPRNWPTWLPVSDLSHASINANS